jgi:hypothetical protein
MIMSSSDTRNSARRSIASFPETTRSDDDPFLQVYSHAFIRDVSEDIMPAGDIIQSRKSLAIKLSPGEKVEEQKIFYLFRTRDTNDYAGFEQAISDFIRSMAWILAHSGQVHYEIYSTLLEAEDHYKGSPIQQLDTTYTLGYIPGKVIRVGTHYLQLIPLEARQQLQRKIIPIRSSNVWRVQLPSALGNVHTQQRLLDILAVGSTSLPQFVVNDINRNSKNRVFDSTHFYTQKYVRMTRTLRRWGWNPDTMSSTNSLEYFWVYRKLRFAVALTLLRDHIVLSINDVLRYLKFQSQLILEGFPTVASIENTISQLHKGEIQFDEALSSIDINGFY